MGNKMTMAALRRAMAKRLRKRRRWAMKENRRLCWERFGYVPGQELRDQFGKWPVPTLNNDLRTQPGFISAGPARSEN